MSRRQRRKDVHPIETQDNISNISHLYHIDNVNTIDTIDTIDAIDERMRMSDMTAFVEEAEDNYDIHDQRHSQPHYQPHNDGNDADDAMFRGSLQGDTSFALSTVPPTNSVIMSNMKRSHRSHRTIINDHDDNGDNDDNDGIKDDLDDRSEDEMKALSMLSRDDGETIKRLVNSLHQKNAECRAMSFQLQHHKMQVIALQAREQELITEQEKMSFLLAQREQDMLLLETKLRTIASFEGGQSSHSLEEIRGKLLSISNKKLAEVNAQFLNCQLDISNLQSDFEAQQYQLQFRLRATEDELQHVCDHLSQRTVLYAYQERRWNEANRLFNSNSTLLQEENHNLKGRLEQIELQYERCDKSRVELELKSRQYQENVNRLETEVAGLNQNVIVLNDELSEATAQVIALQSSVDRLRGTDIADLERNLLGEVESARTAGRVREDHLRRQLDEVRKQLQEESNQREDLLDTIKQLRDDLADKTDLLRNVQGLSTTSNLHHSTFDDHLPSVSHLHNLEQSAIISDFESTNGTSGVWYDHYVEGHDKGTTELAPPGFSLDPNLPGIPSDGQRLESMHDPVANLHSLKLLKGMISSLQHCFDSKFSVSSLAKDDTIEQKVSPLLQRIVSPIQKFFIPLLESSRFEVNVDEEIRVIQSEMSALLYSIAAELYQYPTRSSAARQSIEVEDDSSHASSCIYEENGELTRAFLVGVGVGVSPASSIQLSDTKGDEGGRAHVEVAISSSGGPSNDLSSLEAEIYNLRNRENILVTALRKQGKKLAIVLRKASELPISNANPVIPHGTFDQDRLEQLDELKSKLETEQQECEAYKQQIIVLDEQLRYLRGELELAEQAAITSRELGRVEAASDFDVLRVQCDALTEQNRSSTLKISFLEDQIAKLEAFSNTMENDLRKELNDLDAKRHGELLNISMGLNSLIESLQQVLEEPSISIGLDSLVFSSPPNENFDSSQVLKDIQQLIAVGKDGIGQIQHAVDELRNRLFSLYSRFPDQMDSDVVKLTAVETQGCDDIGTPQVKYLGVGSTPILFRQKPSPGTIHDKGIIDVISLLEQQLIRMQVVVTTGAEETFDRINFSQTLNESLDLEAGSRPQITALKQNSVVNSRIDPIVILPSYEDRLNHLQDENFELQSAVSKLRSELDIVNAAALHFEQVNDDLQQPISDINEEYSLDEIVEQDSLDGDGADLREDTLVKSTSVNEQFDVPAIMEENQRLESVVEDLELHISELEKKHCEQVDDVRATMEAEFAISLEMVRSQYNSELDQLKFSIQEVKQDNSRALAELAEEKRQELDLFVKLKDEQIEALNSELQSLTNTLQLRDESIQLLQQALQVSDEKFQYLNSKTKDAISEAKRKMRAKYREAFELQAANFDQEKNQIIEIIRKECDIILAEAKAHIKRRSNGVAVFTSAGVGSESPASKPTKEVIIYPEMLSPEVTYELVRSIASRSQTEDDFKLIFEASRKDFAETQANVSVRASFSDSMAALRSSQQIDTLGSIRYQSFEGSGGVNISHLYGIGSNDHTVTSSLEEFSSNISDRLSRALDLSPEQPIIPHSKSPSAPILPKSAQSSGWLREKTYLTADSPPRMRGPVQSVTPPRSTPKPSGSKS